MLQKYKKLTLSLFCLLLAISTASTISLHEKLQSQTQHSQNIFLSNFEAVSNAADVSLRNLQQNRDIDVEKQLYALTSALSSMEATLYYGADAVGSELLDGRKGIDFGSIAALLRGMGRHAAASPSRRSHSTRTAASLKKSCYFCTGSIKTLPRCERSRRSTPPTGTPIPALLRRSTKCGSRGHSTTRIRPVSRSRRHLMQADAKLKGSCL